MSDDKDNVVVLITAEVVVFFVDVCIIVVS